jgi:hypothetical protein
MPRGFGTPRAEAASSCASLRLRPVCSACSPMAGKGFPMPVAGSKLPRPVAAGRWGQPTAGRGFPQPKAGKGFPQPVAIGRQTPRGW